MRALAVGLLAVALLAGCPGVRQPCARPDLADCEAAHAMRREALRGRAWMLDAESFGRRDAGQPGADRAAHFLAAEMQAAGLRPGGTDGTYLQKVPLAIREPRDASVHLGAGNVQTTLVWKRDFAVLEAVGETRVRVDLQVATGGASVRGRAAVVTVERAADLPAAAAALDDLARQGAAAALLCVRGREAHEVYAAAERRLARPLVRVDEPAASAPAAGPPRPRLVLALAPPACEELLIAGAASQPAAPLRLRAAVRLATRRTHTWNAVGIVTPHGTAAGAPLLVSAPLDGPGLDLAGLLEVARALRTLSREPPRPVVFLAAAASGGTVLGLRYFRAHPTVPGGTQAAHAFAGGATVEQALVACARLTESLLAGGEALARRAP